MQLDCITLKVASGYETCLKGTRQTLWVQTTVVLVDDVG